MFVHCIWISRHTVLWFTIYLLLVHKDSFIWPVALPIQFQQLHPVCHNLLIFPGGMHACGRTQPSTHGHYRSQSPPPVQSISKIFIGWELFYKFSYILYTLIFVSMCCKCQMARFNLFIKSDKSVSEKCVVCNVKDNTVHFFLWMHQGRAIVEGFSNLDSYHKWCESAVVSWCIFGLLDINNKHANFFILHAKWFMFREHQSESSFDCYVPKNLSF